MNLSRITNFLVLASIKLWAQVFYRVENKWLHENEGDPWKGVKLIAFLNHTSLYEPLFLGAAPWSMLRQIAGRLVAPASDATMNRPIAGSILRFISPHMIPISRKRDASWDRFLNAIREKSVVIILPEGRMMRADGLDKHGKPMTVRGGIADILQMIPNGDMAIIYSGGLHHVQVPGQLIPKFFKRIQIRCEKLDIAEYIKQMKNVSGVPFKKAVVDDMQCRLAKNKPGA